MCDGGTVIVQVLNRATSIRSEQRIAQSSAGVLGLYWVPAHLFLICRSIPFLLQEQCELAFRPW